MEKTLWIIPALLLGSCAADDALTAEPAVQNGNSITAVCETPASTRSGMNSDRQFVWKAGDAVGVMSSAQPDANIAYQLDPANHDMTQGRFLGGATKVREGEQYYAYYPYTVGAAITDDKLKMTIPAVQTYEPESFPTMANPSISLSATADNYEFRNVCGFLEILVKGDAIVTEIILEATKPSAGSLPSLTMLSGSGTVDLTDTTPILELDTQYGDNSSTIKINCGGGVQLNTEETTPFIAVVPAGHYYAITVEIHTESGEKYSYIRGVGIDVLRNGIATFEEIDFEATPLTPVTPEKNVFTVRTPAEWNWIAVQVDNGETFEGKTILLDVDLDFAGKKFIPMGCAANYMNDTTEGKYHFMGTLDGQDHKFLNVSIDRVEGRGRGIIGQSIRATIKNVKVENMTVTGPGKWTAGIVGLMQGGTMENCHVTNISIDPADVGATEQGIYKVAYRLGGLIGLWTNQTTTPIETSSVTNCSLLRGRGLAHRHWRDGRSDRLHAKGG